MWAQWVIRTSNSIFRLPYECQKFASIFFLLSSTLKYLYIRETQLHPKYWFVIFNAITSLMAEMLVASLNFRSVWIQRGTQFTNVTPIQCDNRSLFFAEFPHLHRDSALSRGLRKIITHTVMARIVSESNSALSDGVYPWQVMYRPHIWELVNECNYVTSYKKYGIEKQLTDKTP